MRLLILVLAVLGLPALHYLQFKVKRYQKSKKRCGLLQVFRQLTSRHKLSIKFSEVIGNRVIGLDQKNKRLLVVDHNNNESQELCIPLRFIASTKVIEERCKGNTIVKIFLVLKHKWLDKVYSICFFDASHDHFKQRLHHSRRALVWKHQIDDHKYPGRVSVGQEFVL